MALRHDQQPRNKLRFDVNQQRVSLPLVPEILPRVSHSLNTRADRTNGREMLCSPEFHQITRTRGFSNAPLPCVPCFCSVSKRATVHARTRQWAVRTHGCDVYDVTSATTQSSSVRACRSAVWRGWSGTNKRKGKNENKNERKNKKKRKKIKHQEKKREKKGKSAQRGYSRRRTQKLFVYTRAVRRNRNEIEAQQKKQILSEEEAEQRLKQRLNKGLTKA